MPADQAICSAFALNVYRDNDSVPVPPGYTWLCDCPANLQTDDYFATAYYSATSIGNGMIEVILAHRGTVLNFANLLDDLLVAMGKAPDAYTSSAKPFTDYVVQLITSKFSATDYDFLFVHTGHSLGAIHATLCTAYQVDLTINDPNGVVSYAFESPGVKPIVTDLIAKGSLPQDSLYWLNFVTVIYNADANVINCCNEHVANVFKCEVEYDLPQLNSLPLDEFFWIFHFTPDQHHMIKMYNYWHKNQASLRAGLKDSPWPIGYNAGYQYYQSYDTHPDYWDQVLQAYWNDNSNIQQEYKQIYGAYIIDMKQKYFSQSCSELTLQKITE